VVHDSELLTAFVTSFDGVVKNCSVEPCGIVEDNLLVLLVVRNFVCKVIGFVEL
jgi:hypothetical protein